MKTGLERKKNYIGYCRQIYHEKAVHVKGKGMHSRQQNIIHDTEKNSRA